uniref:GOLD domain-containing protein n=1 Tax=Zosterops lateralis melanops TaxID=1220523 RepID=A0A8D2QP28_ZOSLA
MCWVLEEFLCLTAGGRQQVPQSVALLTEADRKTGQIEIPVLLVKHHSCSLMQLIEQFLGFCFQVITGGHYDVDCRLEDPDGIVLYKEMKKQYDSFTFTASRNGTYKFCFSNEFSTFTHKTVYFDFQVGEDPPLFPSENRVTALTQMESACVSIHEALKSVIDYQTHFRLREAQGRSRAEDLNTRVAYWSIGEAIILLVVSIGQVFLLKSFFSDKRTTTTRVGS